MKPRTSWRRISGMCSPNFSLYRSSRARRCPLSWAAISRNTVPLERVPQAFRDVGIDTAVLLLVGDCQGKDLPLGEFIEIAHGPNVAELARQAQGGMMRTARRWVANQDARAVAPSSDARRPRLGRIPAKGLRLAAPTPASGRHAGGRCGRRPAASAPPETGARARLSGNAAPNSHRIRARL